jgi:hypothetical protein
VGAGASSPGIGVCPIRDTFSIWKQRSSSGSTTVLAPVPQWHEWTRARRDPETTWARVAPVPIDHPWIALLVTLVLLVAVVVDLRSEVGAVVAVFPGGLEQLVRGS